MKIQDFQNKITCGEFDNILSKIYKPQDMESQKSRYIAAVEKFTALYPNRSDIHFYSAPGRTEIGGNHTDHQHGCVIAGAVDLDVIGVAAFHDEGIIRIKSEGYDEFAVSLNDLDVHIGEKGSSEIVRGIAARFKDLGIKIGGFDMYTTSNVLGGSGISSSAAFETLVATAIDSYYNDNQIGAIEIAKIGQYAENFYFGKKSGLMDQMVCSVGGFVFLDFQNIQNPSIRKIDFDLSQTGYELIITDTKGDHSDLTDDYVAVRTEMDKVAEYFGKKVLREVDENQFWDNMPDIKKKISDRAVLRAIHFFGDNYRAKAETDALENGRFDDFLALVNESGYSSMNYLQNLYSCRKPTEQGIPLAIMIGKRVLKGKGAIRVHGGGFAGTIQAFVPHELVNTYRSEMDRMFGQNSCYIMTIRPCGGIEIK